MCIVDNEILMIMQDNQGEISLVHCIDVDETKSEGLGNSILYKFLYQRLRLENILHLT